MNSTLLLHSRVKKLAILVTFLICLGLLKNLWEQWQRSPSVQEDTVTVEELEAKKKEVLEKIESDNSDFSQEETIRNELNMKKDGEIILQLPPLPTTSPDIDPTPTATLRPLPAWKEQIF